MAIEKRLFREDGSISFLADKWENNSYSCSITNYSSGQPKHPFALETTAQEIIEGVLSCLFHDSSNIGENSKDNPYPRMQVIWGGYRTVFLPPLFKDFVFKLERFSDSTANLQEAMNWAHILEHPHVKGNYAPVLFLSENHKLLVQKRVHRPLLERDLHDPIFQDTTVPAAFIYDDCQIKNFGVVGNRVVAIDYSFPQTLMLLREKPIPFKWFVQYLEGNYDKDGFNPQDELDRNKPWLNEEKKDTFDFDKENTIQPAELESTNRLNLKSVLQKKREEREKAKENKEAIIAHFLSS